ncbi:hypothetical protein IJ541_11740, partial [bacterium]|nr:hypothetical protein [bacterium]
CEYQGITDSNKSYCCNYSELSNNVECCKTKGINDSNSGYCCAQSELAGSEACCSRRSISGIDDACCAYSSVYNSNSGQNVCHEKVSWHLTSPSVVSVNSPSADIQFILYNDVQYPDKLCVTLDYDLRNGTNFSTTTGTGKIKNVCRPKDSQFILFNLEHKCNGGSNSHSCFVHFSNPQYTYKGISVSTANGKFSVQDIYLP